MKKRFFRGLEGLAILALAIWLCSESLLCYRQIFSRGVSPHAVFRMTGNFDNPGPLGGFIAVGLAVTAAFVADNYNHLLALRKNVRRLGIGWSRIAYVVLKWLPVVAASVGSVMGLILLPATMSRASWIAFGVAGFVYVVRQTGGLQRWQWTTACAIVIIALIGAFYLKKDSALGRLHIWRMETRSIAESPMCGHGAGSVLGAYGRTQEKFFAVKDRPSWMKRVAGCPEYAFNEYLKVGVERGLLAMIISILFVGIIVSVLLRRRSPFGYGMLSLSVFAFFSYPLSLWQFKVLLGMFVLIVLFSIKFKAVRLIGYAALSMFAVLLMSKVDDYMERKAAATLYCSSAWSGLGMYEEAVSDYESLYDRMSWSYRYLYDYGYALFMTGKYAESIEILKKGSEISCDPMFHNIIGRNYEAMEDFESAEKEYVKAHNMVPGRLYPLILLMALYDKQGNKRKVRDVYAEICSIPINPKVRNMQILRHRADALMYE